MNIWIAASDNDVDAVKKYIETGQLTANSADANGYTPIHAAASYGHLALLDYLINEAKGDINIRDNDGDTPLHTVEDVSVARHMVEKLNADFKIKNDEGQTAFDKLLEDEEFPEVVEYLRTLNGEASTLDGLESAELPANSSIRLAYQEDAQQGIDEEQRERLRQIMESENPEEGMREFLRQAVHEQFSNGDFSAEDSKRRRTD